MTLSDYADLSEFRTEGSLLYAKPDADVQETYEEFLAHPDPRFKIYRRADVPRYLHFDSNPREGDPVIVPNGPFSLRAQASSSEMPHNEQDSWSSWLRSATDAGDEGDLLCRRAGYSSRSSVEAV